MSPTGTASGGLGKTAAIHRFSSLTQKPTSGVLDLGLADTAPNSIVGLANMASSGMQVSSGPYSGASDQVCIWEFGIDALLICQQVLS